MKRKDRRQIGILMADRSNPFWIDMKRHYERLAERKGYEIECFWPVPTHDPSAQSDMLLKMIESGFDAVIVNPLNNNNLVSGVHQAALKKIPIVDVGAKTDQRLFERIPTSYIPLQTVDFLLQGRLGADYIINRFGSGKKRKVAILEGRAGSAQSIGRADGAAKAFKSDPNIELLIREQADFDRRKAGIVTKGIYQTHGKMDAFFCVNDLMALGVSDAVSDFKNIKRPIIVGVDMIDDAKDAIKQGLIAASVAFSRGEVAALALKTTMDCIDGLKSPSAPSVLSHLVTIENIELFND